MRYLIFDPVSKVVTGYQESPSLSGAGVVPDADGALYAQAQAAISAGALHSMVTWDGTAILVGTDPRALFNVVITTDQPTGTNGEDIILADGVSTATVTITMVDGVGATVPYTGTRIAEFFDGRIAMLNYVSGVAVKTFTSKKSGVFKLASTEAYKLTGEVTVFAVEV